MTALMAGLVLSREELEDLTDGLRQPAAQLKALHGMGYVRAHRPRGGAVVLPRAHYLAVEEGRMASPAKNDDNKEPQQHGDAGAPNMTGMREWAERRRQQRGQKTQGR